MNNGATTQLTYPRTDVIVPIGDIHYGYKTCNVEAVKKAIKYVEEHDCLWMGMGDLTDNTSPSHKFYDPEAMIITPQRQIFDLCDLFKPIADKCIFLLQGNHEIRSLKEGINVTAQIERFLGIPKRYHDVGTQKYFSIITKEGQKINIFATHGTGYSRSRTANINKLLKMINLADADLYMMGHTHDAVSVRQNYIVGKRTVRERVFVNTGTFMDYFNSYAEKNGYQPYFSSCFAIHLDEEISLERIV